MATECTQEAVLRFLTEKGGRVRNADLTAYFKPVLSTNPAEKASARALFKSYVDNIAVVKVENGEKFVCLRKRFRGSSKQAEERNSNGHHVTSVKLQDHVVIRVSANEKEAKQKFTDSLNTLNGSAMSPSLAMSEMCNKDAKQNQPSGSGSETDLCPGVLQTGSVPSRANGWESKNAKQELPLSSDCGTDGAMGVKIPLTNWQTTLGESLLTSPGVRTESGKEMGTELSRTASKHGPKPCDTLQISHPQAMGKGLPQTTMGGSPTFDFPDFPIQTEALGKGGADQSVESCSKVNVETGRTSPFLDEGRVDCTSNTPKGSRKSFIQHMISSSPQVRRSIVLKHPIRCRDPTVKSDGDSYSVQSANAEEESSSVTLEPVEHEWMMCACDGEWESLHGLLVTNPNLVTKKDFVTGFTCLHWAAKLGKHELLALLVNFARQKRIPLDVNVRSAAGYTPLHLAAMHNHIEVIKMLVGACNADVDARDYSGRKASQYLRSDIGQDVLDIAGADPSCDTEYARLMFEDDSARWKLPKVLQANLKLLHRSASEEEARDFLGSAKEKPLRRKSSLNKLRPRLSKRGAGMPIVHSISHIEQLEGAASQGSGLLKSRPKSNLFG